MLGYENGETRNMQKKTSRTFLLAFISLLLLIAITVSASAQVVTGSIRYRKDFGVSPAGPGHSRPRTDLCDVFSVAALDSRTNKLVAYMDKVASPFQRADTADYYVCRYTMKVPFNRSLYVIPHFGGVLLLPQENREPYNITDAWIGGSRSKPPAGYERSFTGQRYVTLTDRRRRAVAHFEMIYADVRGPR